IVLDPDENCPCQHVAHQFINANYDDEQSLVQLGELSDVITYEFENISANQLQTLVSKYNIPQGYQAIQLLQDRLIEKQTLQNAGTQVAPFVKLSDTDSLSQAVENLDFPFMIKTRFGGNDGKEKEIITNEEDLDKDK